MSPSSSRSGPGSPRDACSPRGLRLRNVYSLPGQVVVVVAAGAVVRLAGIVHLPVPPDDQERVEVQGGALAPVHRVEAVGVEGVLETLGVLAVGGEREHVRCRVQEKPRGGVEDLPPEVQHQRGKDEGEPPGPRGTLHDVGKPLLVERRLVDDPRPRFGVGLHDALQVEGAGDLRDVRSRSARSRRGRAARPVDSRGTASRPAPSG